MRKAFPLALALGALVAASPGPAAGPLQTAVNLQSGDVPAGEQAANLVFRRIRQAGATAVRLTIPWKYVAPTQRPAGFDPSNPDDPAYNWTATDREVTLALANGLQPLMTVFTAPSWAEQGSKGRGNMNVSSSALGQFATAITTRYSGSFEQLPRVRTWLVWNEPNLSRYLAPQLSGKRLVGAIRYRSMVNAFAKAAHAVRRDNVVVAGLVAPFTFRRDPGPLRFLRAFLCMSAGKKPKPTCLARVQLDTLSVHPYTSGGPRHRAFKPDDVSLGDLPRVRTLLRAAVRAHHVVSSRPVQFWVTEFSWDSKPPDPQGVPLKLQSQWVSEAVYRAWRAGASLFTWYLLVDKARPSPFQSGLYFQGSSWIPKPALAAFRFPFVAFRQRKRTFVWGRAPGGKPETVVVEKSVKHGWKRVVSVRTNKFGIFSRTLPLRLPVSRFMRARVADAKSIAFPLKLPPDRFVTPFGS